MALRDLNVKIGANTAGFNRGLKDVKTGISDLKGTTTGATTAMSGGMGAFIGKLGIAALAIKGIQLAAVFTKESIGISSSLTEVQNVVDTTFGSMSGIVNDFAKNSISSFGMSELSAKKYTSTMGAILKSTGFAQKATTDMSISMTGLAGDMASFYNLSAEDAFMKIQSGITGEIEPLRRLGVVMSETNLSQFALTQGIMKNYSAMTEQEKIQLRYQYLMKTTADAQGDFAKTSGSWANQTRILSESWKQFQGALGGAFIAVLAPVLKGLNFLIQKLIIAANYVKAFFTALTGNKAVESGKGAVGDLTGDIDGAKDAQDGLTEATKETAKAQQKLAGWDKINTLPSTKAAATTTGATTGASSDWGNAGEIPAPDTTAFEGKLDNLKGRLAEFANKNKEVWSTLYNNTIKPISDVVAPIFSDLVSNMKTKWGELKTEFSNTTVWADIMTIWNVMTKVWGFWGTAIAKVWGYVANLGMASFFIDLKFVLKQLEDGIGLIADLIKGDFSGAWGHFKDLIINNPLDWIKEKFQLLKEKVTEVAEWLGAKFSEAWSYIKAKTKEWWDNDVAPWFTIEKWTTMLSSIGESMGIAIGKFLAFWTVDIPNWWANNVSPWFTAAKWEGLYDNFVTAFKTKWSELKGEASTGISSFWNDTIKPWFTVEKWKELGTNMKDGIVGGFKAVVYKIYDIINGARTLFSSFINGIIDGYNSIADKTPGLKSWSPYTLAPIPYPTFAARGGIVSSPTLAMIGENGSEAIMPLENNTGWIDRLAAKLNTSGGGGDVTLVANIYLDDGTLVDKVVKKVKRENMRLGKAVLEG